MDPQTEKEPAPHKKTPPGWLWWSLLGAGLYVLDQASKLWIIRRFPLNYLNEKLHKYAYLPDFLVSLTSMRTARWTSPRTDACRRRNWRGSRI